MDTIDKKDFQACFVNTENHPKKIVKYPIFKVEEMMFSGKKVVLQLQTWYYDHPDTCDATISILGWQPVHVAQNSIPAFEALCKGMESLEGLIL